MNILDSAKPLHNIQKFSTGQPAQDGRSHVGIENVRSRLAALCGGTLEIHSKPDEGTTAVITIPKGNGHV